MPGSIIVENDYYGKGLALGFCNHWFALGRLKDAYNSASNGDNRYDIREYDNRARPWITAMMLVNTIGTFPVSKNGIVGMRFFLDQVP